MASSLNKQCETVFVHGPERREPDRTRYPHITGAAGIASLARRASAQAGGGIRPWGRRRFAEESARVRNRGRGVRGPPLVQRSSTPQFDCVGNLVRKASGFPKSPPRASESDRPRRRVLGLVDGAYALLQDDQRVEVVEVNVLRRGGGRWWSRAGRTKQRFLEPSQGTWNQSRVLRTILSKEKRRSSLQVVLRTQDGS